MIVIFLLPCAFCVHPCACCFFFICSIEPTDRLHRGFINGACCFCHFTLSSSLVGNTSINFNPILTLPRSNRCNLIKWSGASAFPIPWSFCPSLFKISAHVVSYSSIFLSTLSICYLFIY